MLVVTTQPQLAHALLAPQDSIVVGDKHHAFHALLVAKLEDSSTDKCVNCVNLDFIASNKFIMA
jgi:hypothetical protein